MPPPKGLILLRFFDLMTPGGHTPPGVCVLRNGTLPGGIRNSGSRRLINNRLQESRQIRNRIKRRIQG